jgi:hypothetical protein
VNHAIHLAAISQMPDRHRQGRADDDRTLAEGQGHEEALRAGTRRIGDAVSACMMHDAQPAG